MRPSTGEAGSARVLRSGMIDDADRQMTKRERVQFATVLAAIGLVVMVLTTCASCQARPAYVGTRPDRHIAVARLMLSDGHACTAWDAGGDLVVTADHCCKRGAKEIRGSRAVPGSELRVLVRDADHDICVLRGEIRGDGIPLAARDPDLGDPVWTSGWPAGVFLTSDGLWSGRQEFGDGTKESPFAVWGVSSITVYYGASGSPVLDGRGRAVGVIVALMTGMDGAALVAPLDALRADLAAAMATP